MNAACQYISALTAAVLLPFAAWSQTDPRDLEYLSIENGLSQSTVKAIVQDAEGFMWFGTQDGLNRYDGYTFRVFRHDFRDTTSLPDNSISSMVVDRSRTLWIGTRGGVTSWDAVHQQFLFVPLAGWRGSDNGRPEVTAMCLDSTGGLWVGTTRGLFRSDAGTLRQFRHIVLPEENTSVRPVDILTLLTAPDGTVWTGVRGISKLMGLRNGGGDVRSFELPVSQGVWAIAPEDEGFLLIGTWNGGLLEFSVQQGTFRPVQGTGREAIGLSPWTLLRDRLGVCWVGTGGMGLFGLRDRTVPPQHYALHDNYVLSLCEDRSGILWIGLGKGIQKLDRKRNRFIYHGIPASEGKRDRDVWAIEEKSEGGLWIGTNDGLAETAPDGSIRRCNGLTDFVVRALLRDQSGTLWITTASHGLLRLSAGGRNVQQIKTNPFGLSRGHDDDIPAIHEDRQGRIWIGTSSYGLSQVNPRDGSLQRFNAAAAESSKLWDRAISCIEDDAAGFLWVGTESNGICRIDPASRTVKTYAADPAGPHSLRTGRILSLHSDKAGHLWIGTAEGLHRFEPATGKFTVYDVADGLPNNVIYGILEDDAGGLWLSTNNGICRFDPEHATVKNYSARDGLQSNEFNRGAFLRSRSGRLFFGGINGISEFLPSEIGDNGVVPPIAVTDFRLFDRSVNPQTMKNANGEIEIPYSSNYFSVEFSALDFTSPASNRYAYKLEGLDKDWIECGSRHYAAYTNLNGGRYVLRIRGCNNDGVWNNDGTSLVLRVVPPFWRTTWFQVLAVVVVIVAVMLLSQRRIRTLKEKAAAQQEMSRRILESQEDERKRIGAGLHDSLGQNLLLIKNLTEMAGQTIQSGAGISPQLQDIAALAAQSLAEVREVCYDLRPYQLDRLGLTGALRSILSRAGVSSSIDITSTIDNLDGLFAKPMEIHFFRIVQEAVNNILKHSKATSVAVGIHRSGDEVVVEISDNGIGYAAQQGGFGVSGMMERARILGGRLSIASEPGKGTIVSAIFQLPGTHS